MGSSGKGAGPRASRSRMLLVLLDLLCLLPLTPAFHFSPIPPRLRPLSTGGGIVKQTWKLAGGRWRSLSPLGLSSRSPLGNINPESFAAPPPEKVLKAVEKAGYRVTTQDVAVLAGVDLSTAQKSLVKLASLVDGDLEVGREGELVYNFPSSFRSTLKARSFAQRFKEIWLKVWPGLFYALRVAFGLVLILSIALVFTTIFAAGSYSSSSDREDDRRRGGGGMYRGPSFFFSTNPFDFLWYRPYGFYYTGNRLGEAEEMGFLESCFSYIFGDGDPNANIDEERYRVVAQIIRENGGAVVAEQLAPFLDPPEPKADAESYAVNVGEAVVDESFMLPVLTRLNGKPEVTEEGQIVYVFPELMTSAVGKVDARDSRQRQVDQQQMQWTQRSASELRQYLARLRVPTDDCFDKMELMERLQAYLMSTTTVEEAPTYLEEKEIPFSLASSTNRVFAGLLGAVNLLGALFLGNILRTYSAVYTAGLPGILGLSQALYGPLLIYAIGFNVIPLLRSQWLKQQNAEIAQRNERRQRWARLLDRALGPLYMKIAAARNYNEEMKVVRREDVEYTTAKSAVEQQPPRDDFSDFDKRSGGR